jgi:hypothetical protein
MIATIADAATKACGDNDIACPNRVEISAMNLSAP